MEYLNRIIKYGFDLMKVHLGSSKKFIIKIIPNPLAWNLQKLMINDNLNTVAKLQMALIVAEVYLSGLPKDAPYQNFELR